MTRETCDVCGNDTISPQKTKRGDVFCPRCWGEFKKSVGADDEPPEKPQGLLEDFEEWAERKDR